MKRRMNVTFQAGKATRIAHSTGIHRVDFLSFFERVARSTSFNRQEVDAVLNMPQKLHVISYSPQKAQQSQHHNLMKVESQRTPDFNRT